MGRAEYDEAFFLPPAPPDPFDASVDNAKEIGVGLEEKKHETATTCLFDDEGDLVYGGRKGVRTNTVRANNCTQGVGAAVFEEGAGRGRLGTAKLADAAEESRRDPWRMQRVMARAAAKRAARSRTAGAFEIRAA
jgi:hypothetical protein